MRWRKKEKYISRWDSQSILTQTGCRDFWFSCCLLTLATWQMMKNIRPNQRPGRTFVCWSWGSSGRRTRRSSSKLCSRWSLGEREPVVLIKSFSVYVRHRPPSRRLQGKKVQGEMPCVKSIKLYHPLTIQVDQRFIERKDFLEMMQVTFSIPLDYWMLLPLMPVVSVLVTFGQHL